VLRHDILARNTLSDSWSARPTIPKHRHKPSLGGGGASARDADNTRRNDVEHRGFCVLRFGKRYPKKLASQFLLSLATSKSKSKTKNAGARPLSVTENVPSQF
jgi:hypothetical protein